MSDEEFQGIVVNTEYNMKDYHCQYNGVVRLTTYSKPRNLYQRHLNHLKYINEKQRENFSVVCLGYRSFDNPTLMQNITLNKEQVSSLIEDLIRLKEGME